MSLIKRKAPKIAARGTPQEPEGGLYFTSSKKDIDFISSGCALLDCVLGGGWTLGRMANIVGDKSTGKTLLAIEACANFARQYPEGDILYIEAESAFDKGYAEALGLPVDKVRFAEDVDTVEALFEEVGSFIGTDLSKDDEDEEGSGKKKGEGKKKAAKLRDRPGLIVVDSLDALSDDAEMQRGISEGSFGASKAKQLSQFFRRLIRPLGRTKTCVLIISQVRDAIGVMFGDKLKRSGGHALDFYATQALWLSHIKTETTTVRLIKRPVALTIRARCKKNKIGLPLRECEFQLRFGYGIEDLEAGFAFLKSIGKEKLVQSPEAIKKLRGPEFVSAREALNKVIVAEWHEFEKNFVPKASKYG